MSPATEAVDILPFEPGRLDTAVRVDRSTRPGGTEITLAERSLRRSQPPSQLKLQTSETPHLGAGPVVLVVDACTNAAAPSMSAPAVRAPSLATTIAVSMVRQQPTHTAIRARAHRAASPPPAPRSADSARALHGPGFRAQIERRRNSSLVSEGARAGPASPWRSRPLPPRRSSSRT